MTLGRPPRRRRTRAWQGQPLSAPPHPRGGAQPLRLTLQLALTPRVGSPQRRTGLASRRAPRTRPCRGCPPRGRRDRPARCPASMTPRRGAGRGLQGEGRSARKLKPHEWGILTEGACYRRGVAVAVTRKHKVHMAGVDDVYGGGRGRAQTHIVCVVTQKIKH